MRIHFVIHVFLVMLLCKGYRACFKDNSMTNRSITTLSPFYAECCCMEPEYSVNDLQWLDPNNIAIGPGIGSNIFVEKQDDCLSLQIQSASQMMSGSYRCITKYGGKVHSQTHNLDVYDPLYFFNTAEDQYIVNSSDSKIFCQAKGASKPFIRWYRGKEGQNEILNGTAKYLLTPEGLIINNVVEEDVGIYKCSASVQSTGEELEIDIKTHLMTKPVIEHLTASPENSVIAGYSLIIECAAEGIPTPNYTWQKLHLKAEDEKRNTTWQQDNYIIRFETVEIEDAGIYQCYVKNVAGNASSTIEIKVLEAPKIIDFKNRTAEEGSEIPIHCNATGIPTPNVTITYEGKSFNDTMYEEIPNYSLLKVTRAKEGLYICNASNEVNFVTEFMYLTVEHPPYFAQDKEVVWGWNGEKVVLNCENQANPPSNITWRYKKYEIAKADENHVNEYLKGPDGINKSFNINEGFTPYGIYECKVNNKLGSAVKLIQLRKGFVPIVIQNVSILEVTITTATFLINSDDFLIGPPILGYIAEYDLSENYNVTNIHLNRTWAKDRPFKLEKLRPNSTYSVRFAAINKVGTGPWTDMLQFDTLEKSAPEPPIWEVDSLQFAPSNVLKWKEPEDNGEPIDYYTLRYCPVLEEFDESLCKGKRIEAATEQELDDLQYNTTYYFELIAHNSLGNSTSANISLSVPGSAELIESAALLSQAAIIGISVVLAIVGLIFIDLLLLLWRRQGIIALCFCKKSKKKPDAVHTRDKKGLLRDNGENIDGTLRKPNNGHREYEYNKTTGIITGKHSSV